MPATHKRSDRINICIPCCLAGLICIAVASNSHGFQPIIYITQKGMPMSPRDHIPDALDVLYMGNAATPAIPAGDYDKIKMLQYVNKIEWKAPTGDAKKPPGFPEWKIIVYQKKEIVYTIEVYGIKGRLFYVPEYNLFCESQYWLALKEELRNNKSKYGEYIEQ